MVARLLSSTPPCEESVELRDSEGDGWWFGWGEPVGNLFTDDFLRLLATTNLVFEEEPGGALVQLGRHVALAQPELGAVAVVGEDSSRLALEAERWADDHRVTVVAAAAASAGQFRAWHRSRLFFFFFHLHGGHRGGRAWRLGLLWPVAH